MGCIHSTKCEFDYIPPVVVDDEKVEALLAEIKAQVSAETLAQKKELEEMTKIDRRFQNLKGSQNN